MKKFLKLIGILLLLLLLTIGGYYFLNNEKLPVGTSGKDADALANKMLTAIQHENFKNTEVLEWSFRNKNHYKWYKRAGYVTVKWDNIWVKLYPESPEKSIVKIDDNVVKDKILIKKAHDFFNNDSFWLVAPHKIFDNGTQRSIVKHNNKDALMVTYTSGGTTPGDSYLWILDENHFPIAFKMWTKIIPIGGVSGTWSDWKTTEAGIQLPTKHQLSLFDLKIDMGNVKAYNKDADALAKKVLKSINHEQYKTTKYLEWSFAGRRSFKWNKENYTALVSWDTIKVDLDIDNRNKSKTYFNNKLQQKNDENLLKKAWDIFNNDSFWLVAPHKLFDDGVVRNIETINGKEALRVTYTKGGTTPGDSYVWILGDDYIPTDFKMYLKNGRMNGTPATWQDWITTESGTKLPTNHVFSNGGNLSMGTVKAYN